MTRDRWLVRRLNACSLGRLGAGLAYGEAQSINARRRHARRLVLPLAARVGVLLVGLVARLGRRVLPRELAPLRLCVPRRPVP